jgi:hypothetical protein
MDRNHVFEMKTGEVSSTAQSSFKDPQLAMILKGTLDSASPFSKLRGLTHDVLYQQIYK